VTFTVAATGQVTIQTSGTSRDTELRLYNSSGTQVAYDDDSGESMCSRIVLTLAPGTYYARVNEYGNNGTIDSYNLAVTATTLGQNCYMLTSHWGGTWTDADKSSTNSDDDLMCWAAATSNMLQWTGWGQASGLTSADAIFSYFCSHWSDQGGNFYYGCDWWFDGTNDQQGTPGWSQVEVAGGGFFPTLRIEDYLHTSSNTSQAPNTINSYLRSGYAVGLSVRSTGGHAITCWGVEYAAGNPNSIVGVYVTDSDDNQSAPTTENLRYYQIELRNDRWYLRDYYGTSNWYVSGVYGLARRTSSVASGSTPTEASAVAAAPTPSADLACSVDRALPQAAPMKPDVELRFDPAALAADLARRQQMLDENAVSEAGEELRVASLVEAGDEADRAASILSEAYQLDSLKISHDPANFKARLVDFALMA
jgi:hypothetical protein